MTDSPHNSTLRVALLKFWGRLLLKAVIWDPVSYRDSGIKNGIFEPGQPLIETGIFLLMVTNMIIQKKRVRHVFSFSITEVSLYWSGQDSI